MKETRGVNLAVPNGPRNPEKVNDRQGPSGSLTTNQFDYGSKKYNTLHALFFIRHIPMPNLSTIAKSFPKG